MAGVMLRTGNNLSRCFFLREMCCPHFTGEGTEAQRGKEFAQGPELPSNGAAIPSLLSYLLMCAAQGLRNCAIKPTWEVLWRAVGDPMKWLSYSPEGCSPTLQSPGLSA